ncbi:hypothetical protein QYE76_028039 [Lolium multiflorum]|uniref:Aminotransferase-like plant mobile domain-containing protein n=1 Tax=Lolium multiflorum TaxID=4521 RepID=A0AAD8QK82_LOLMU|nr:hypothetical protein QYE76_028039 [Lolium multiflorum]
MNAAALTALVDRWRPETHTFHLRAGEMTPTLQDVSMILGLPIQGEPLCMNTACDGWREQMANLIGMAPPAPANPKERAPAGAPFAWIRTNFGELLPEGAERDTIRTYTRVYLWYMLSRTLFADSGGKLAHWCWLKALTVLERRWSWGTAALAYLYRQYGFPLNKRHRGYAKSCLYNKRNDVNMRWSLSSRWSPSFVYDLANGGDLIFERDRLALSEFLGRSPPVFYGGQIADPADGQLQWLIMASLPGKPESPMFRQIQFSLRENNWVDGLARALQEALARLCGQNSVAIEGERFAHFARHSSLGLPLSLPYHPVLRHHVDHLDFMLFETRAELDNSRSVANHTQNQLNQYAETIKVLAKERRTLRQLVAKRDSTIHRLKAKLAIMKETIATQAEQLQILEGEDEGEDIQGDGYSYVSNDNDYEEDDEGDLDFHQHLPAGMDTTFPLRIDG